MGYSDSECELYEGATCNAQRAKEVAVPASATALCDIEPDRGGGPPKLKDEAESFHSRCFGRGLVHLHGKVLRLLTDPQPAHVCHALSVPQRH